MAEGTGGVGSVEGPGGERIGRGEWEHLTDDLIAFARRQTFLISSPALWPCDEDGAKGALVPSQ